MDTEIVKSDGSQLLESDRVTTLGRTVKKAYVGVVEERQWLRGQIKKRIAKIKKDEKDAKVKCEKCAKYTYKPYMEDDLRAYYSQLNSILDSLSRFDSKHDLGKLLESIVVESARVAYDMFLKYVPDNERDNIIFEYMNNVKMKTEDMIRRSAL